MAEGRVEEIFSLELNHDVNSMSSGLLRLGKAFFDTDLSAIIVSLIIL